MMKVKTFYPGKGLGNHVGQLSFILQSAMFKEDFAFLLTVLLKAV